VYFVSLSPDPRTKGARVEPAPLDIAAIRTWLNRSRELHIDGRRCSSPQLLLDRLTRYWLCDENIVYIGKATSLRARINAYYNTPLGNRGPHAGGHWVKVLSVLDQCHVHFAHTTTAEVAQSVEKRLLRNFAQGVSAASRRTLPVPERPLPFANLGYPDGERKQHGLTGTTSRRPGTSA